MWNQFPFSWVNYLMYTVNSVQNSMPKLDAQLIYISPEFRFLKGHRTQNEPHNEKTNVWFLSFNFVFQQITGWGNSGCCGGLFYGHEINLLTANSRLRHVCSVLDNGSSPVNLFQPSEINNERSVHCKRQEAGVRFNVHQEGTLRCALFKGLTFFIVDGVLTGRRTLHSLYTAYVCPPFKQAPSFRLSSNLTVMSSHVGWKYTKPRWEC